MIYLLGKLNSPHRISPLLSMFFLLKKQGQPVKIITPVPPYHWEKLRPLGITPADMSSLIDIVCHREKMASAVFSLDERLLAPDLEMIRGENFYFINQQQEKKFRLSFFDVKKTLMKELKDYADDNVYEYDDRGFIFSIYSQKEAQTQRVFIDDQQKEVIKKIYEKNQLKEVVVNNEKYFTSENEFNAWAYQQLLLKATDKDRFLLFDVNELVSFFTAESLANPALFLVPDVPLAQVKDRILSANSGVINSGGIILETEAEKAYIEKQTVNAADKISLHVCNYFTVENTQVNHQGRLNWYINLGKINQETELAAIIEALKSSNDQLDRCFILEIQGVRNQIFIREYLAKHQLSDTFLLIGNAHTKVIQEKLLHAELYMLFDEQCRAVYSFMKAIEYEIPILTIAESLYTPLVLNRQIGIDSRQVMAATLDEGALEELAAASFNFNEVKQEFSGEATLERLLKILNGNNRRN